MPGIARQQPHLAVVLPEPLDGDAAIDPGNDDLAVQRLRRGLAGHQVTIKDAVVDHRIPLHAQQEIRPGREQPAVDLQVTLDAVSGEDRLSGCHPSHQRQPQGIGFVIACIIPSCIRSGRGGPLQQPDAPRLAGAEFDEATRRQRLQVLGRPGGTGPAEGVHQFVQGRGQAMGLQMPVQEVQHLTLAFGECSHGVNYYTNISPTSSFIRAASSSRAPTAGCGASGGCFCSQSSSASTAIGRASR